MADDEYLTTAQICAIYKVTRAAISKWCKAGQLPYTRVGNRLRVPRAGLESFLAASAARYDRKPGS